jgi:hypothetical protein
MIRKRPSANKGKVVVTLESPGTIKHTIWASYASPLKRLIDGRR